MPLAAPSALLVETPYRTWDVVVVGAGLSGSLAAYGLARRGLAVLMVDKAAFPRWKVCGSCLNPRARAMLAAVGLGDLLGECGAVPTPKLFLAARGRRAELALPGWIALSRERLDAALVQSARQAGVTFLDQTSARLGIVTSRVRRLVLRQGKATMSAPARLVLAADGLNGRLLADAAGVPAAVAPGSRIGAGLIIEHAPDEYGIGAIHMAYGTGGYVGLVRLEDGRLNLAAAFDADAMKAAGGPGPAAGRILDEVGWPIPDNLTDLPWRGTPPLTRQSPRPAAERVMALGDAAGYVEPFTGEGMAWALASGQAVVPLAERAVRNWHAGCEDAWARRVRRTAALRQRFCRAVTWVSKRPALARAAVGVLGQAPWLARIVLRDPFRDASQKRCAGRFCEASRNGVTPAASF